MKYVLLLLVVLPGVIAHEESETSNVLYSTEGAYAGSNSFDGVNPFLLVSQQRFGQALFALVLWAGMILGLFELVKLILSRVLV